MLTDSQENCRYEHPRDAGRSGQGYNDNRNQNRFGALSGNGGGGGGGASSQGECNSDFLSLIEIHPLFPISTRSLFMLVLRFLDVLAVLGTWDLKARTAI
jgi:hypothetical protein